ncbi:M20 family metallopeptidase [Bradyrhizobium erythrophlei]|jgi:acetylornithine deacetylase/succinyl-diaminopimelate desuccinylase-like protein|uniref:Acetylornithine deacetylase/Succinyl-diaminopimelate desuccinylase n=1 Tax=Bradyrhizobium erythrophlei TaxID=1437360 RepID=A0A1M5X407_9BRAD|nr:M20 family metallopeptidase [Bradyrhizobium erythrophlei]SHH93943.1 Acetylornithine deacetylase/Succinyl-diaminopimelate desuccinylase [Bradyrhizobium erythrophlei]
MTRTDAIARAQEYLHSGAFLRELDRRVAYPTESQNPERRDCLRGYLEQELQPAFAQLDFSTRLIESPSGKHPYLLAEYRENASAPTVLMYGHGDVVDGMVGEWRDNLDPWRTTTSGNRVYGRGTADNKGQHSINLSALRAVREARGGRIGFNAKFIVEMGEEIGSPDLRQVCESLREELKADLFLASDGPRLAADRPTIFLGCRGGVRIHLDVNLRDGSHHSGNWGGVLANPATILASAIATLVDGKGHLLLDELKPPRLSNQIRAVLADVKIEPTAGEPTLSENWGEEGFSAAERLYAWNTLEVLAMSSGNIEKPANAIPGRAQAVLQLRFVVGTRVDKAVDVIRARLDAGGFPMVEVRATQSFAASRTDFDSPWVNWTAQSIRQTTGKAPAVLPNFGGSLPNDVFSDALGLPTIWVPHSYPGCSQHAPDEHILLGVTEEALGIMAGLFWDLGEMPRAL